MLAMMVEETPAGARAIAISRTQPPPELERARLARQMDVIGWPDLRLQRDEALALAGLAGRPRHEDGAVLDALLDQSQGWVAGLVLLLEHMRHSGPLRDEAHAGSQEAVFGYFAGQVFNASSPRAQQTLMRLSVMPHISPAQAVAISGDPSATDLLDDLARHNLFTDRRPGTQLSYQFHALFRAFLQDRARRLLTAPVQRQCLQGAIQALREAGQVDDAVRLCLDGQDNDAAIPLVLQQAESLIQSGRHRTLAAWIEALPRSLRDTQPWLVYWHSVALVGQDPTSSRAGIERALAAFDESGDLVGQVRATASLMAGWWAERFSLNWLEPHAQRLAGLLERDTDFDLRTRTLGLVSLARARLMMRPSDPALAAYARRLEALPIESLSPELVVGVGTCLINYHWGVGDSEACAAIAHRTRPAAERSDVPMSDRLWFWFWLMTHHVYCADVEAGREVMHRARQLGDVSGQSPPLADFVRWDVTFELQLGRPDRARRLLETELLPLVDASSLSTQACIDLEQARCAIEEQRLGDAIVHAQRAVRLCDEGGLGWLRASLGLTLCCAQALSGRVADAQATLQALRARVGRELPILLGSIETYQALIDLEAGQPEAARASIGRAMQLRQLTTYPWGPGWNRPGIARVAAFALEEGLHVQEMQRMVARLRLAPPSPDLDRWPWPVRIRVLDGFVVRTSVEVDEPAMGKAPHRLMALLKALAALGGDAVPADDLAGLVWPDAEGDRARRSLDTSLSRLRRLLRCDDALLVHDGKVSLHPHRVSLDLRAFAYHRARMLESAQGSAAWMRAAERAAALVRRPLLDGEPDEPWLMERRTRLHRQWADIVDRLAQAYRSNGDHEALKRLRAGAAWVDPGTAAAAPAG
jgi:hypothetical protein